MCQSAPIVRITVPIGTTHCDGDEPLKFGYDVDGVRVPEDARGRMYINAHDLGEVPPNTFMVVPGLPGSQHYNFSVVIVDQQQRVIAADSKLLFVFSMNKLDTSTRLSADVFVRMGDEFDYCNQAVKAVRAFRTVFRLNASHTDNAYSMGKLLYRHDRDDVAHRIFRKILTHAPEWRKVTIGIGVRSASNGALPKVLAFGGTSALTQADCELVDLFGQPVCVRLLSYA
jgi:hypothetical protein